ncbi:MAG: hypothetical protein C0404_13155 [Verrucomicrobia bacterium]|nr:hypothetical protein [Verrucomicrobiota bacterium]
MSDSDRNLGTVCLVFFSLQSQRLIAIVCDTTKHKGGVCLATSIQELMQYAGVGRASVYRVLTGSGLVGEAARSRVMKAVEELGKPALRRRIRASARVAIWVPGIGELIGRAHHASLFRALEAECRACGLTIEVINAAIPEHPAKAVELVRRAKVCGVMVMSFYSEEHLAALSAEWPVVLFFACAQCKRLTTVAPDDFAAGFLATRHLIEQGHARIAAVIGSGRKPEGFSERFAGGYALALAEGGIPFRPALVLRDSANLGPFTDDGPLPPAFEEIMRLKPRPTALVGRGETIAVLVRGLNNAGISVPGQIAVVGYGSRGGVPWPAPDLSWVDYPVRDMAEAGLDAIAARGTACRSVTIPVRLVPGKCQG